MYMFNMYRPCNAENEFMTDEPEAVTPVGTRPTIQDLYPDTLEDVLEDILDTSEMRCEYNRELITFFTSTTIALDEKIERLITLYPHIKNIINTKNHRQFFDEFVECCLNDLRFFYELLSTVTSYKENKLPKNFPIIFELSSCVEHYLRAINTGEKKITGEKQYHHQDGSSEVPTLKLILKTLKPHIEPGYQQKFNAYFDILTVNGRLSFERKPCLDITHASLKQKLIYNKQLHNQLLALNKCPYDLTTNIAAGIFLELKLDNADKEFLLKCRNFNSAVNDTTVLETSKFVRNFFHSICQLETEISDNLRSFNVLFLAQQEILKPCLDVKPVKKTMSTTVEPELKDEEEKTMQESAPPLLKSFFEKDDPTAQDILKMFAEFKEKKLKRKPTKIRPVEETKEYDEKTTLPGELVLHKLVSYNLQSSHIKTLSDIFKTPIPHYQITWKALKTLIKKCGGYIYDDTGASRRIIRLYSMSILVDDTCINQRGLHQLHRSGHNEATVSRWTIKIFQKALERAGITEEILLKLNEKHKSLGNFRTKHI